MEDFDALKLGTDNQQLPLDGIEENRAAACALVRQATRQIQIVSRCLDPPVLNQAEISDAIRKLIRDNMRCQVLLLVLEPGVLAHRGHRLVNLAQQFASFIQCRKPDSRHEQFEQAFILVDQSGVLYRPLASRWNGIVNFHDPSQARQLATEFNKMWEFAVPDSNLHRLTL